MSAFENNVENHVDKKEQGSGNDCCQETSGLDRTVTNKSDSCDFVGLRQAADQGDSEAQYNLGLSYQ